MEIYIPTRGRARSQVTLESIPDATLVVYKEEIAEYQDANPGASFLVVPPHVDKDIASKRRYIMARATDNKVLMFDDDLDFAQRRSDEPTKFLPCDPDSISRMLDMVDLAMDSFAHGGIAAREGGNRYTESLLYNYRAMRGIFFRRDILHQEGVTIHGDVMCDFYTTLSLLTRRRPNVIINGWVTNQKGSGATGGCSVYRTPARQTKAAEALAASFPRYVKLRQVQTKDSWGGGTRTDVRVQWKRAYDEAPPKVRTDGTL